MPDTDERFSPPELIDFRDAVWVDGTDTDPCWHPRSFSTARYTYTKRDDGRVRRWWGRVWLNPPWSDPGPWLELVLQHLRQVVIPGTDPHEAMVCVRNDPSTGWWSDAWETADAIVFLSERTRYWQLTEDGELVECDVPTFTTVVFYYGPNVEQFIRQATAYGHYGVDLRNHSNGRRIRPMAKDPRKQTAAQQKVLDGMVRRTLAEFARAHPEMTLFDILDTLPIEGGNGDLQWTLRDNPFLQLRVRDLWPEGASANPRTRAANSAPNGRAKSSNGVKKTAKKAARNAPKKTTKKAPKKKAAKKAPKKIAKKATAKKGAAKPRTASRLGPTPVIQARVNEIVEWITKKKKTEFIATDVMDALNVSRQTALRALIFVPNLRTEGQAKNAKYVVTQ